jgi:hypothetical protein
MGRSCSICQHDSLDAIESSLIHGEPLRSIAGRHRLSATALHRHKTAHLPTALVRAQQAEEMLRADSLLGDRNDKVKVTRRDQVKVTHPGLKSFSLVPNP